MNNGSNPYKLDPKEMRNILPPLSASDLAARGLATTKYKYNCRIFDIQNDRDRQEFEELMSRFHNEDPEVAYHQEQSTFSKDGDYYVVLRWISNEA